MGDKIAKYTLAEHQAKKLFPKDGIHETVGTIAKIDPATVTQLNESAKGKKGKKLIVKMEAIHVGRTKNFTYYTEEGLKAGLNSWTQPYNKPVLTHHNEYRGEPIGRILDARFEESTLAGKPGLIFTVEISDPDAVEKVLDGRYQTVSIGASTDKVICNICGTDRTEEWCEHFPGETYGEGEDKQTAHFIIGTTFGREVSYVNTPADENAGNRSIEIVQDDENETKESVHMEMYQIAEGLLQNIKNPSINLFEGLQADAQALINRLAEMNERSEPKVDEKKQPNSQTTRVTENTSQTPEGTPVINEGEETQTKTPETTPIVTSEGSQENITISESAAKITDLTEAQKRISELETKLSEAQTALTAVTIEKTKLDAKVAEMKTENDNLLAENARLLGDEHKQLATKVVEMKITLRKPDVIGKSKEDAIAEHIKRTKESLNDLISDLTVEMAAQRPEPNSVQNPGIASTEENKTKENKYTLEDADNILKGIFGGRNKKK